jgi:diguanylate cyclase (GGDEF)-like protein
VPPDRPPSDEHPPLLLRPWFWAPLALAGVLAGLAAGLAPGWVAAAATLGVGAVAATAGARPAAAALATAGALVAWVPLGAAPFAPWEVVGVVALGLVAALIGATLHDARRRTALRARDGERRAQVLADVALALGHAPHEEDVLSTLPPLVARVVPFEHASVLRPRRDRIEVVAMVPPLVRSGHEVTGASISGRAARTGIVQHVEDTHADPEYVAVPGIAATRSEFALPLRVEGRTVAVLNVERRARGGFGETERATLTALGRIAEAHLVRLETLREAERERQEADLLADVARRLTAIDDPQLAAATALEMLVDGLGQEGGAVFGLQRGVFRPLATSADLPRPVRAVVDAGIPWGTGRLYQVWHEARATFLTDAAPGDQEGAFRGLGLRALALVPVQDTAGDVVAVIAIGSRDAGRDWSARDRRLLDAVAGTLGASLARATQHAREVELLDVVRGMAQSDDVADLYRRAVEAALRMAPGAEAATLSVRGPDGRFAFQAAVGYDLATLQAHGGFSEEEQVAWYGQGLEGYRAGRPRLLVGEAAERVVRADRAAIDGGAGGPRPLRANLCTPIAFQGEVVGVLNVDAFGSEDAFGGGSLSLAEALGQHVAAIVRLAHDRAALARSALTDPLTGVGNREAFNRKVAEALALSQRHDQPMALAMIDLNDFKAINDRLGHEAGDRALALVADTLVRASRASDSVFRWGGDEFAVVIPLASASEAHAATERFTSAIGELSVLGMPLAAGVGLATYPEDGPDAESLMRRADDLMYAAKENGGP